MESIEQWLNRKDIKEIRNMNLGEYITTKFLRDPFRSIFYNPDIFYAPADGVVIDAYDDVPPDQLFDIKGKNYCIRDLLQDETYDKRSLLVDIFMTVYDCHINRAPTTAYFVDERVTDAIMTHNMSMLLVERDLLDDRDIREGSMQYLYNNERRIGIFYCPFIKGNYYVVQIADRDVDAIVNWKVGQGLLQGDRYGEVRWGSHVSLVIPLVRRKLRLRTIVKPLDHVEAGIDPIVEIVK